MTTVTTPDGTTTTTTERPDPRFGMNSPVISRVTRLPSGLTRTETTSRTVTLADPGNPLTMTSMTDVEDVNGRLTRTVFDKAALTTTVTSPANRVTKTFHDAQMRVTRREVTGILPIDFAYDARGRLSTVTQGSRVRSTGYFSTTDARNGYVQSVTNALSQTTQFEPDALGRFLQQMDPDSAVTGFGWDATSNLTSVTPPGQPSHGQSFTELDLLSAYTPPSVAGVSQPATFYSYNLDRQLVQTARPDGLLVGRVYDSAGKLDLLTTPGGNVDYEYFGLTPCAGCAPGRLSRIADPSGVVLDLSYDGMLQTGMTWSGAVNGAVAFGYDASFRVTSETVTVGATVSNVVFGYDADDITICASPSSCAPAGSDAFRITLNGGNGLVTGSTMGVVTDALTYNGYGELASIATKVGAAGVFSEVVDTAGAPRDALGRIVTRTETNGGAAVTDTYTYDVRGRLTDVHRGGALYEHYGYDANGNRTLLQTPSGSTVGTYDAQERLLTYGAWTFAYTANGELATKTDTASGEVTAYQYDVRGNLLRVDLPGGDVIEYLVDGQGRRVGRKKNGVLEKQWLYRNALNVAAELDGQGNLVATFVYVSEINAAEVMLRGGATYRIATDHLGSPRAVVDVATGNVVWRADYDAWGKRTVTVGSEDFLPMGFAGGLYDAETGLTRFGARDFAARTGGWTARDPIVFDGGQPNVRGYVSNDPVNRVDWFGLGGGPNCTACFRKIYRLYRDNCSVPCNKKFSSIVCNTACAPYYMVMKAQCTKLCQIEDFRMWCGLPVYPIL